MIDTLTLIIWRDLINIFLIEDYNGVMDKIKTYWCRGKLKQHDVYGDYKNKSGKKNGERSPKC